jgi:hypothetical protein
MMNDKVGISSLSKNCKSCGSELTGKYCSTCGEKKYNPLEDLSIIKFIEHSIDILIHLDSKVFKTFKMLFFYPGMLTSSFISGRRVSYMKPFQLFILAGALFYLLIPSSNAYFSTVEDLKGNDVLVSLVHYNVDNKINEKAIQYHISREQVVKSVIERTIHSSKLYLFTILPFWALFLFALFHKSNQFYVSHLLFSLHCFTFFLLIHMLYLYVLSWFMNSEPLSYLIPLFIIFVIYVFLAVRKVYHPGILASLMKCMIACSAFLFLLELYRESITVLTLFIL